MVTRNRRKVEDSLTFMQFVNDDLETLSFVTNMGNFCVELMFVLLDSLQDPIYIKNGGKEWIQPTRQKLKNDWENVKQETHNMTPYFARCDQIIDRGNWPIQARAFATERMEAYRQMKGRLYRIT